MTTPKNPIPTDTARRAPTAANPAPAPAPAARSGVEIWQGRPGVPMQDWRAQALRRAARPRVLTVPARPAAAAARAAQSITAGPRLPGPRSATARAAARRTTTGARFAGPRSRGAVVQPSAPLAAAERAPHKRVVKVNGAIGVGALAAALGVKAQAVLFELMRLGAQGIHVNSSLDSDTAALLANGLGWSVENTAVSDAELVRRARPGITSAARARRAPVVTVMGHVDHGKTTLLDRIRQSDVAAHEAGGITQRIGAYTVETPRGRITFIDTPGHAAFSALRARGARATDIVVLVVAADDGIMPQTREALEQARAAGVPVVVALNKIDRPGADTARVRQELAGLGLVPEEWGGETLMAELSALHGQGVPELLEKVLLQAEMLDLQASAQQAASGLVLEAELDRNKGPLTTLLIKDGTLRKRDFVVAGSAWGKVRALFDERGRALDEAGPATPVVVFGLSELPRAGDLAEVVQDAEAARLISERRKNEERERALGAQSAKASLLDLARFSQSGTPELKLVLKADTDGSLDALRALIAGLGESAVKVRVAHAGVGAVNESDVRLAAAGGASLFAFNVGTLGRAERLAQESAVRLSFHSIIYELGEALQRAQRALLGPAQVERELGLAEVLQVFRAGETRAAGARVTSGLVRRGARVKVLRGESELWRGGIASLRRLKDDVREVREGLEFGLVLNGFDRFEVGDRLQLSEVEEAPLEVRRAS